MARGSIRRRFLLASMASAVIAVLLFAVGSVVMAYLDDTATVMDDGDPFREEAIEFTVGATMIAGPLALLAAIVTAAVLSRRAARPLEDAIRAARQTSAHDLRRSLAVPEHEGELRDLVVSLNDLFVRLDDGFGAVSRFSADASHELRTPIAVMATEIEVALRRPRSATEWEQIGQTSLQELRRLTSIIEGLLSLARAGADAPEKRSVVRVVDLVDSVVLQVSAMAESAGIDLAGPEAEITASAECNPVMIELAVRNLVSNAIAAVPRGGRVKLGLDTHEGTLMVTVDDDGPGLGADPEPLFVPFHRGTEARVDGAVRRDGVGLGLAIARRIATAHQGTLTGSASTLGGARFTLVIPRVQA